MAPRPRGATGPVVVDCSALQSPTGRGRGIARYAEQWAIALEEHRPDLVGAYLLDPALPPPGAIEPLLASGKVRYGDDLAGPGLSGARVYHALAPLDLACRLPRAGTLARTATVYDLIPALDPERELADPLARRRYRTRLEWVRAADQLHVLSAAVGRDLERALGVGSRQVVLAGAAPAAHFRPVEHPSDLEPARQLLGDLEPPFVLHPGGSHPRKNTERLLEAWSLLPPELRDRHRLVLTGRVPPSTAHHYRHLASTAGFASGLVVAGEVGEAVLVSLYQAAALACFPSLAEGYGLPVAEAIACGTAVIASDLPPLDELLDAPARFDPGSAASIAAALAEALGGPGRLARLRSAAHLPTRSFAAVAEATAAAFDRLVAGPRRRQRRTSRPRLAFVSPFPPSPTGVAPYSYHLVEALQATGRTEVDAYLDGPTRPQQTPAGAPARPAAALPDVERLLGPYDAVCYCLGNSHHHLGALALLRRRPGTVLAHDVRLSNCYRHETGDPGLLPGGLARAIHRLYPQAGLPPGLGSGGQLSSEELERYGLLMAREAIGACERYLVSSAAAAALARLDARPQDAARLAVLPFALSGSAGGGAPFEEPAARQDGEAGPGNGPVQALAGGPAALGPGPLLAHFGLVDPVKQPELLLAATALLLPGTPGLHCAFVGPIAGSLARRLRAHAEELGCGQALVLTGPLPPAAYQAYLERATVAVQLRASFNGEASAAVGECLAAGVPTVVSEIGWARELPAEAAVKLPAQSGPGELAAVLEGLLADEPRRRALGEAGRREAGRRTFAATATALLDLLAVASAASQA